MNVLIIEIAPAVPGLDTGGLTVALRAVLPGGVFLPGLPPAHQSSPVNHQLPHQRRAFTSRRATQARRQEAGREGGARTDRCAALGWGRGGCGPRIPISDAPGFHCVQRPKRPEMAACSA